MAVFTTTGRIVSASPNFQYHWITEYEPPLNVPCPICKAGLGITCKKIPKYKKWSKKRKYSPWWASHDKVPHQARIRDSKVQEVNDALDRDTGTQWSWTTV